MTQSPAPPQRYSSPTRIVDGREVVNIDSYVPFFFAAINNSLSRGASQRYLDEFSIGIVEWRILSVLATEPKISATRICEVVALEKSSASRGLKSLDDKGMLDSFEQSGDPRRKLWQLNAEGLALHDKVLTIALERERHLLRAIDPADLEIMLRVMRQMRENVKTLQG